MNKLDSIEKSLFTHYYKLDWSTNYGKTREKIYLAIKGKVKDKPILYLQVRNVGSIWHETDTSKIEKISKSEFMKNATKKNVARFYGTLQEYNNLLNYPSNLWIQNTIYNFDLYNGKKYKKANKKNNKKSVLNELKRFKQVNYSEKKSKSREIER